MLDPLKKGTKLGYYYTQPLCNSWWVAQSSQTSPRITNVICDQGSVEHPAALGEAFDCCPYRSFFSVWKRLMVAACRAPKSCFRKVRERQLVSFGCPAPIANGALVVVPQKRMGFCMSLHISSPVCKASPHSNVLSNLQGSR